MSKYSELADALRDCAAGGLAKALNEGGADDLTCLDKAAAALRELDAERDRLRDALERRTGEKAPFGVLSKEWCADVARAALEQK